MSALVSVRFTTARTTSYIAYLRPIITGPHRSHVCSRVCRLPSRVFRSPGTYHDQNHNDEWPQFSRYKPRDDIDALTARIKLVKRNAEARIFNAVSLRRLTVSQSWQKCLDASLRVANNSKKTNRVSICTVKLYSITIERIAQKHFQRE